MKVKKIRIGIKDIEASLDGFVRTAEVLGRGGKAKKEEGVYFTSLGAFRKALTIKRFELLHIIRTKKPSSINELARLSGRNVKNVAEDIKYLAQVGLVEKKESAREISPSIDYDRIMLEIAV